MPTSGLVITLSSDPGLAGAALAVLRARTDVTPGELRDRWLPIALESPDAESGRLAHDTIAAVLGVEFVDVAYVDFDDEGSAAGAPAAIQRGES